MANVLGAKTTWIHVVKVHLKNENVLKVISEVISLFRILINMNFLEAECQVGGTYIKQNLRNGHSS